MAAGKRYDAKGGSWEERVGDSLDIVSKYNTVLLLTISRFLCLLCLIADMFGFGIMMAR